MTAVNLARGLLARKDLETEATSMTHRWCTPRQWKSIAGRLHDVIESCDVNRRFEAAIRPIG